MAAPYVAVIGPGEATGAELARAEQVGRGLAEHGAVVICGGLGGVMEAASRGARAGGGPAVGILPGAERSGGNRHLTVAIPTGLGELRNGLIIRASDAVIAIGGGFGTLSEIGLALKSGVTVIGLDTWPIDGIRPAGSPAEAVELAIRSAT